MSFAIACPCGSGRPYPQCCGPLHTGAATAQTPEQLMRSRYSAFARGERDYLLRTWHPRTRPVHLDLDGDMTWTGLVIHDATGDEVAFTASYRTPAGEGSMTERSRFARRGGRWFYLDGDVS